MLTMAERKYLLEAVMDAVDGRADVIVHAGMFAEKQTIELAQHAEKCGAAAVSSVPPFFFPSPWKNMKFITKKSPKIPVSR